MTQDEYIGELETLVEDNGLTITQKCVERLAKRAVELQLDNELDEEEIVEELIDILPKKIQEDDDAIELIEQFSNLILAESENDDTLVDDE